MNNTIGSVYNHFKGATKPKKNFNYLKGLIDYSLLPTTDTNLLPDIESQTFCIMPNPQQKKHYVCGVAAGNLRP